jgi:hypothetical protein
MLDVVTAEVAAASVDAELMATAAAACSEREGTYQ